MSIEAIIGAIRIIEDAPNGRVGTGDLLDTLHARQYMEDGYNVSADATVFYLADRFIIPNPCTSTHTEIVNVDALIEWCYEMVSVGRSSDGTAYEPVIEYLRSNGHDPFLYL